MITLKNIKLSFPIIQIFLTITIKVQPFNLTMEELHEL